MSPLASGQQNGTQTIGLPAFQPIDPNSLHVTPITDVRVEGDRNGGGQSPGNGAAIGLNYNKLMGFGARSSWGTTRGPNYS